MAVEDWNFDTAVAEWKEVQEVDALSEQELELAKHFFRWGSIILRNRTRKTLDDWVVDGWGGAGG